MSANIIFKVKDLTVGMLLLLPHMETCLDKRHFALIYNLSTLE